MTLHAISVGFGARGAFQEMLIAEWRESFEFQRASGTKIISARRVCLPDDS